MNIYRNIFKSWRILKKIPEGDGEEPTIYAYQGGSPKARDLQGCILRDGGEPGSTGKIVLTLCLVFDVISYRVAYILVYMVTSENLSLFC